MKLMLIQRISKIPEHTLKQIHKKASIVLQRNAVPMDRYLGLVFLLPGILRLTNKAWNLLPTLDGQILI
jgi:hypothetical protein